MAGIEIFNCNDDYIAVNSIRLCGEKLNDGSRTDDLTLNAPVSDTTNGPFIIPVRTNDAYVGRGFRIKYELEPCEPALIAPEDTSTEEFISEVFELERKKENNLN